MESQFTDYIISLGTGGIFCILVLQQVFYFLGKKKENGKSESKTAVISRSDIQSLEQTIESLNSHLSGQNVLLGEIKDKLDKTLSLSYDLHRWHDVADPDHPGARLWWATSLRETRDDVDKMHRDVKELLGILRRNDGDNK